MRHKLLLTLGVIVLGWAALTSVPAEAITGAGVYYATPSWDQTILGSARFVVLTNMGSQAVLDKETGLVWEQRPTSSTFTWENAQLYCNALSTGGRLGWRLPTVQELASLVDPSQASPALPSGHPFSNVWAQEYWSATTFASLAGSAWFVSFFNNVVSAFPESNSEHVWCMRGGQGVDPQ